MFDLVEERARAKAQELWEELLRAKRVSLAELIPVPIEFIARSLLGLVLEEPEEIPSDRPGVETAGLFDRPSRRVVVAQKYQYEWRRFTIAHEIGHFVLHPDVCSHRDRPLNGGERANFSRPVSEQEADKFAAELLMPAEVLEGYFKSAFGGPIDGRIPSVELASALSNLSQSKISMKQLSQGLRSRSFLLARLSSQRLGKYFAPPCKRFVISPTAMAIRLEELGLVL